MAWIEGLTSSNRILQDLTKILTQANKDINGDIEVAKNWQVVYPRPFNLTAITGETMTLDAGTTYKTTKADWWDKVKPVVYETIGANTTVVPDTAYTVNYLNGTITLASAPTGSLTVDYTYVTDRDLDTAFAKIGPNGRVVLRTKTTAVTPDTSSDPFNTDPDLKVADLEMFLEIEKPEFLINPETGQIATRYGDTVPLENHYHVNMRIFDRYDYVTQAPFAQVKDINGIILDEGAHVSVWSKYSWYEDFKEVLKDSLDGDPGTDNVNDGIVFTYVDVPGLYGEVPIQYWISTNNDRVAMTLMGEPSINYDSYLVSFGYIGKLDSFEGSVNDTAGNFGITTGSSTIPCEAKPNPDPLTTVPVFVAEPVESHRGTTNTGTGYATASHKVSYKVVAVNADGISMPTAAQEITYTHGYTTGSGGQTENTKYDNFRLTFSDIPANATHVRIFRKDITVFGTLNVADTNWFLEAEITRASAIATPYLGSSDQDMTKVCPVTNFDPNSVGVLRDQITGAVVEIRYPKVWGNNTATGINDIAMYKTRSGVYFQQHGPSFITPEPYMKKDAFNPSRYTKKFHLSPLYIVHGYDGYRGFLKDIVVVDNSSIVHLDELIVNKGLPNEEVYKYFKLTAPFSIMKNSANAGYGIGIKKI